MHARRLCLRFMVGVYGWGLYNVVGNLRLGCKIRVYG